MRLVHQTGSVKVGEVVRYTLAYTPSRDRILPTPAALHVKIKNTSTIALRAAYLHGPYTLYAACYPSTFDPNVKQPDAEQYGKPQFEPNLKAGGSWNAQLTVPEEIREEALAPRGQSVRPSGGSVTWIIEVSSQVLFSNSAAVHYEILVGRDEASLDFGLAGMGNSPSTVPGQLSDFQQDKSKKEKRKSVQNKGVYSEAISLDVADTARIWNTPELPEVTKEQETRERLRANPVLTHPDPSELKENDYQKKPKEVLDNDGKVEPKARHKQKVHLVLLTHGLHSNLGADMLYLKESIDAAAKQANLDRKMRKAKERAAANKELAPEQDAERRSASQASTRTDKGKAKTDDGESGDEEEQVVVRGFPGNAIRTERGIQYLGKRLAKYVLAMTYPDQPYLPIKKKSMSSSISRALSKGKGDRPKEALGKASHSGSTIHKEDVPEANLAYKITSISFIGHSLGGLTQTYAIAYIQKHSPEFFELIKPINFIALASPFLGLSNENPLYVKFALDFGLVGRTGQDLGLTWRAPTIARSGWGAMIAGMGADVQKNKKQLNPGSKPLLRILPSGPAHHALRLFRNRTVYSNVVNDGIVPLRTSCLLFLDWRGLGRVEKARRENGLVETMAGWGWAELTGQNSSDQRKNKTTIPRGEPWSGENSGDERSNTPTRQGQGDTVPQPADNAVQEDIALDPSSPSEGNFRNAKGDMFEDGKPGLKKQRSNSAGAASGPWAGFLSFLRPGASQKSSRSIPKGSKIYRRSQTTVFGSESTPVSPTKSPESNSPERPSMVRGESVLQDQQVVAPPKTSVFEAAGDLLNPPLPDDEYLNDPTSRPRTIFHDRVYHPDDIPPPPSAKPSRATLRRRSSSYEASQGASSSRRSTLSTDSISTAGSNSVASSAVDTGSMKVEEKIARAYHRELAWRKVLVRLEPDAHNNIVVRRMFANAYGWPVVKHLVDTHFADTYEAATADGAETGRERAKHLSEAVDERGEEVHYRKKDDVATVRAGDVAEDKDGANENGDEDDDEEKERRDELTTLPDGDEVGRHGSLRNNKSTSANANAGSKPRITREDSSLWDERFFQSEDDDDDEDDDDELYRSPRSPRPAMLSLGIPRHERDPSVASSKSGAGGSLLVAEQMQPLVAADLTQSPTSAAIHGVGLQRSLEEQIERGKKDGYGMERSG